MHEDAPDKTNTVRFVNIHQVLTGHLPGPGAVVGTGNTTVNKRVKNPSPTEVPFQVVQLTSQQIIN